MLHGVEEGRPRAVHRTRVAARRLREVLPVLQLDGDVARRLGRRLRRVTRRLGTVRELDALLLLVEAMRVSGRYDETALSRVAGGDCAGAGRACADACRRGCRAPSCGGWPPSSRRSPRGLKGETQGRAATRGWRWAIDARVRHRADALKEAVDAAGSVYLAERVHAVRITLKKFRYAVELKARDVARRTLGRRSGQPETDAGLLGRLHDRQVLMDRVRQVQASLTPPDLGLWRALDALLDRGREGVPAVARALRAATRPDWSRCATASPAARSTRRRDGVPV